MFQECFKPKPNFNFLFFFIANKDFGLFSLGLHGTPGHYLPFKPGDVSILSIWNKFVEHNVSIKQLVVSNYK